MENHDRRLSCKEIKDWVKNPLGFPAFDYFCVLAIEHEDWYYSKDNNSKSIWGCFQLQDSFGFPSAAGL